MNGPQILLTQQGAAGVTVTPGTASLTLSAFAPTVLSPRLVTVGKASLTLSTFAPVVSAPRLVTVGNATLTTATFAPTVSAPRLATVGTAVLTLTTFAPDVTASAGGAVTVTPGTASLALTAFAPDVSGQVPEEMGGPSLRPASQSRRALTFTPKPAHLRLVTYPPVIALNDDDLALLLAA